MKIKNKIKSKEFSKRRLCWYFFSYSRT